LRIGTAVEAFLLPLFCHAQTSVVATFGFISHSGIMLDWRILDNFISNLMLVLKRT
tara:strand:+ start:335 stop:502 length:168 start_codon:yes stop_codon:yes gene_type:complete